MKNFNDKFIPPQGFKLAGVSCGIKKEAKDLSIIYSEINCKQAKAITKNKVKAAPLLWNAENNSQNKIRAILTNSGNANAGTGKEGLDNCKKIALELASKLKIEKDQIVLSSTGVIGEQLPLGKIKKGILDLVEKVSDKEEDIISSAKAILTTDTKIKVFSVQIEIDSKLITISGMAKGSGMIHPNMATMLAYVVTDANISNDLLVSSLKNSVKDAYNMISVDGDTSTNDMLVALANGCSENKLIDCKDSDEYKLFYKAFNLVNLELAKKIVADGEGVTKVFEVKTINAKTKAIARSVSKSIIKSSLVKTAIFGNDLNWGRVLCAIGNTKEDLFELSLEKLIVSVSSNVGEICVFKNGGNLSFNEEQALELMKGDKLTFIVDLQDGSFSSSGFGCDLSYDYVKINADYRS